MGRMPTAFHAHVRRRIRAAAAPEVRAGYERYFKGAVRFLGARMPAVRRIERGAWAELRARDAGAIETEALALLASPYSEEKHVGIGLLQRAGRRLGPGFLARLERCFDRTVGDWATCDAVCGRLLRTRLGEVAARRRFVRWSRARHTWRRRAAAVAFLSGARHGRHQNEILAVCARLARDEDRFVQLGMGWVLRELWLARPTRVEGFLARHAGTIHREALRYAIEKMPAPRRRRMLALHDAARPRPRRAGPSRSAAAPDRRVTERRAPRAPRRRAARRAPAW
jgi:3-methyladenine DNA glycosylase AlkD